MAPAGAWLALTGARIKAADCELLGLATDVVASDDLPAIKRAICADPEAIETVLAEHEMDAGRPPFAEIRDLVDRLYAAPTLEGIIAALEADGSDFAREQLAILRTKSPLSCKNSLRQLREGALMRSFADEMVQEFRMGARIVATHDFIEGVRAVIVDKDNKPAWDPATPEGVTDQMVDAIFAPLPADEEWKPLADT